MPEKLSDFKVRMPGAAGEAAVSARAYPASGPVLPAMLVLAHGAGAGQDSQFMVAFARGLAARGLEAVTFNFPYMERGRRVPDKGPDLVACWRSVAGAAGERAGGRQIFIGGKSMGGRIASMLAAEPDAGGLALGGLVFLGYPLHPPGRPDQLRVSHWPSVRAPALFVQGSRDSFGSPEELREHLPRYGGRAQLLVVEGGDHSLKVPRAQGRRHEAAYADIQDAIVDWARRIASVAEHG